MKDFRNKVIVVTGAVMSAALIAGQALNLWFAAALRDLPSTENVRLDLTQSIRILDRTEIGRASCRERVSSPV